MISVFRRTVWGVLAATSSLLAFSCSSEGPPPSSTVTARQCSAVVDRSDWHLTADGTKLRDALGRTVLLRGVNAGARSKLAPYMPFDFGENDFEQRLAVYLDRAQSFGFDVLRVPFTWAAVEPTKGSDDPTFLARYDALVDAAWTRGMRVIVDFHQDIYAEAFCGDGFPDWTIEDPPAVPERNCPDWFLKYYEDPAVMGAFDRLWAEGSPVQRDLELMWDRMVARYKDRPGVIGFEPINEPAPGTMDTVLFESTVLTDFYSRMVARMRAAAPRSLVFVDPTGQNGAFVQTDMQRPVGDGIVFAPHFYAVGYFQRDRALTSLAPWADLGARWNVPVLLGEFGYRTDREDGPGLLAGLFDALDTLQMHGTAWEYSTARELWNEENFSITDADGTPFGTAAAITRPFARAVAGDTTSTSFDDQGRTFSLVYRPTPGGATEIALPRGAFPAGYELELSSGCVDASQSGVLVVVADEPTESVSVRLRSK